MHYSIRKHLDTDVPAGTQATTTPTSNATASTGAKPRVLDIVSSTALDNYFALLLRCGVRERYITDRPETPYL
jgi:hypothetical protein